MLFRIKNSPLCLFSLSNELPNLDPPGFLKNSTGRLPGVLVTCGRLTFPRPKQDFEIIPLPCRELFIFPSCHTCFLIHDLTVSFTKSLELTRESRIPSSPQEPEVLMLSRFLRVTQRTWTPGLVFFVPKRHQYLPCPVPKLFKLFFRSWMNPGCLSL